MSYNDDGARRFSTPLPTVKGLTDVAQGPESTRMLLTLAVMRKTNRKGFDNLFDSLAKVIAPKRREPEAEVITPGMEINSQPMASPIQSPVGTGNFGTSFTP